MFAIGQQVVVKKQTSRTGPRTMEIKVGQVSAMSADGKTATVTLPHAGGRTERKDIPVDRLTPAEGVYRRSRVQINPGRRQISMV